MWRSEAQMVAYRKRNRLYMQEYRKKHPDRIKASRAKWLQKPGSQDLMRKWQRNWIQKDRMEGGQRFGGNRLKVLERDGFKCCTCGMTENEHQRLFQRSLTVDHKDGQGRYSATKNHEMTNLWTLCLPCHGHKDSHGNKESQGRALTVDQVKDIRYQVASHQASQADMARKYHISEMTISRVIRRLRWKAV